MKIFKLVLTSPEIVTNYTRALKCIIYSSTFCAVKLLHLLKIFKLVLTSPEIVTNYTRALKCIISSSTFCAVKLLH